MIHIKLPLGHVFGTTGITVLVISESSFFVSCFFTSFPEFLSTSIVNLISFQPSHGIIRIFWSHSHCFVYTNFWSLILTSPKCNRSFVFGSCKFISTYHQAELSFRYILTSSQLTEYEIFDIVDAANENQETTLNTNESNINNFFIKKHTNKNYDVSLIKLRI